MALSRSASCGTLPGMYAMMNEPMHTEDES